MENRFFLNLYVQTNEVLASSPISWHLCKLFFQEAPTYIPFLFFDILEIFCCNQLRNENKLILPFIYLILSNYDTAESNSITRPATNEYWTNNKKIVSDIVLFNFEYFLSGNAL